MDIEVRNSTAYWRVILVISIVLAILLIGLNLALGSVYIPLNEVVSTFIKGRSSNIVWENILIRTRLPQTITAASAGMGLGIAGLMMQTLFRNPLAGPSVLGISSGASLGVAIVVMASGQLFGVSLSSIGILGDATIIAASLAGALAVLLLILSLSKRIGGTLGVLILGVMVGYMASSIVGILKYYSKEADVHSYVIWGLGSFSRLALTKAYLFAGITIIFSFLSFLLAKQLNIISLGERYAANLGVKVGRARMLIILFSGILTAIVTAFCGPIVFIGLAVPHLVKLLIRTSNHIYLVAFTAVFGVVISLFCNLLARLPGLEVTLPINSVTAFIGAPVVISVIMRKRKATTDGE
jgi:iron complex transport system permease protein